MPVCGQISLGTLRYGISVNPNIYDMANEIQVYIIEINAKTEVIKFWDS